MAEEIFIPKTASKKEVYESLLPQIDALVQSESDLVANLANISAVLKTAFDFLWVGFYLVKDNELVLGPFQGPLACTRIAFGKGVCGSAWMKRHTLVVPDVDAFPGHIACSSASKSEIVVPVLHNESVAMVLDVDSAKLGAFDNIDSHYLELLANDIIAKHCL